MFSATDLEQIKAHGLDLETVNQQISHFKTGFPFLDIQKAASVENNGGILKLDEQQIESLSRTYEEKLKSSKVIKFVPASGAASRMFKAIFAYREVAADQKSLKDHPKAVKYLDRIKDFAFAPDLALEGSHEALLASMFDASGLNYAFLPKGLIKFHEYENEVRTPLAEHLVEGAQYCKGSGKTAHLHFTVSPQHLEFFKALMGQLRPEFEKRYDVLFDVSYSVQDTGTDTIAVDPQNQPFREENGKLLFRPAGHGALLKNLSDLEADVIFIKNIDNVVHDDFKGETIKYKKALAGKLVALQSRIFGYLDTIDGYTKKESITEIEAFLTNELFVTIPEAYQAWASAQKEAFLHGKLNRPIRVCGMVKNLGEPGGGPFWIKNEDGSSSLQIAETAQIDLSNTGQKEILSNASHFNPVDLILSFKNYKGKFFDIMKNRDSKTGFISEKSKNGKELKAQELPGLWNGSMADWNTIFVEVPVITFNPVKEVNDLLRNQHLPASKRV